MRGVTVGALGNPEYVKALGKKSTESDIQLASFKEDDVNVSLVIPVRYPEKVQPLAYSVLGADAGLLVVHALNKDIGEQILALDAAGLTRGLIVLQNYLQPEQLAPLLAGTTLEKWDMTTDDKPPLVRQKLASYAVDPRDGPVRIPIDHHFEVKGIGNVILGFVKQGEVKKHDVLRLYPSKTTAQVRSIQVHDADVDAAGTGAHVGLALKNIDARDIDRGQVLAPEGTMTTAAEAANLKVAVRVSKFYKVGVTTGRVLYLALGMQFVGVKILGGDTAAGASGTLDVEVQKPFTYAPGESGVLFDLDTQGPRVAGRVTLS